MRTIDGFIYTLRPYERGIRETVGKYFGLVIPPLGFQIPLSTLPAFATSVNSNALQTAVIWGLAKAVRP
jgi:hypothetical protein